MSFEYNNAFHFQPVYVQEAEFNETKRKALLKFRKQTFTRNFKVYYQIVFLQNQENYIFIWIVCIKTFQSER
jgi:hypothetical protein